MPSVRVKYFLLLSFSEYDLFKAIARQRMIWTRDMEFARAAQSWFMTMMQSTDIVESKNEDYSRLNTKYQK